MITAGEKSIMEIVQNHKSISKLRLTKLLFLISQETKLYDFVPYHFGPFSFQIYHDLAHLKKAGYLSENGENIQYLGVPFTAPSNPIQTIIGRQLKMTYTLPDEQLLEMVYSRYPWYTIFSLNDRRMDYSPAPNGIFNIGYEGRSIDGFLDDLLRNKIGILIDVRNNPFSFKFGFSKSILQDYLSRLHVEYIHIPELGIPSSERKKLGTIVEWNKLMSSYDNKLELLGPFLDRLKQLGELKRIALMCVEKDPNRCHRGRIAHRLRQAGIEVTDL